MPLGRAGGTGDKDRTLSGCYGGSAHERCTETQEFQVCMVGSMQACLPVWYRASTCMGSQCKRCVGEAGQRRDLNVGVGRHAASMDGGAARTQCTTASAWPSTWGLAISRASSCQVVSRYPCNPIIRNPAQWSTWWWPCTRAFPAPSRIPWPTAANRTVIAQHPCPTPHCPPQWPRCWRTRNAMLYAH